jgi:hypothetical protein
MPTIAYGPRVQAREYDQENGEAGYQRIGLITYCYTERFDNYSIGIPVICIEVDVAVRVIRI